MTQESADITYNSHLELFILKVNLKPHIIQIRRALKPVLLIFELL